MARKLVTPVGALLLGLSLAAAPVSVSAQAQDWQKQLTAQMQKDYDCEVAFYSHVAERTVNGDVVILAKVHCVDKRTFDAYRANSFTPFEIHPCENPDNRVC